MTQFVAANGLQVGYESHGAGPPLVIDSCWLSHLQDDWESPVGRHYLTELGKVATVYRFDERRILAGRIESAGQVLHLVMNDPWFAWLRPMSALVVQADETLDNDHGVSASDVAAFGAQIRDLLQGPGGGPDCQPAFQRVLQEAPEAVVAQGRLTAALAQP